MFLIFCYFFSCLQRLEGLLSLRALSAKTSCRATSMLPKKLRKNDCELMYTAPHYSHVIFDCLDGIFLHPCFHQSEVSQPSLRLYHQAPFPHPPPRDQHCPLQGGGKKLLTRPTYFQLLWRVSLVWIVNIQVVFRSYSHAAEPFQQFSDRALHCLGQLTNNRSFRKGNQLPLAVRSQIMR